MMQFLFRRIATFAWCAASVLALPGSAATLNVELRDSNGAPLVDGVVYALPRSGKVPAFQEASATIDQIQRQFVPLVSVIRTGTAVHFPNKDNIRHQVYSFSPAKTFELKLYSGRPAKPVIFDKAGLVVLGCNIHDQMIAYVQVVDTPWFGKTDASGMAHLENLPDGEYEVHAWHYRQAAKGDFVRILRSGSPLLKIRLDTKP
ncbi:MAG: methylamine utilization protein [Proteobacteria bacterium]|nr:methylamine utilization protein [Pseudomonadota bacterium]HQR03226.1 methylamine utilization protein [Rhodocyclaceae bacterium]